MLSKKEQKLIKSLKVKKYRMREKCFLVEGAKNVAALLTSDFDVQVVMGTATYFEQNTMDSIRCEIVKPDLLTQLGTFKTNEDVLAVARMKKQEDHVFQKDDFLFVLDGVSDPGNMGTIIRTLDWFGFKQLVCSEDCADFYHPKVINSTMGSFTRVNVIETSLASFFQNIEAPVYIADMHGKSMDEMEIASHSIIVMGNEAQGIGATSKKYASESISIPRIGMAESLNVAIATGIIANQLRMR